MGLLNIVIAMINIIKILKNLLFSNDDTNQIPLNKIQNDMTNKIEGLRQKEYERKLNATKGLLAESIGAGYRFWFVTTKIGNLLVYDCFTGLLWDGNPDISVTYSNKNEALTYAKQFYCESRPECWRLPTKDEILDVAKKRIVTKPVLQRTLYELFTPNSTAKSYDIDGLSFTIMEVDQKDDFPLRKGKNIRFINKDFWWTSDGCIDLDSTTIKNRKGCLLMVSESSNILNDCIQYGWKLSTINSGVNEDILADARISDTPFTRDTLIEFWKSIDYISARLPHLDDTQFFDPNKGIWEFFNMPKDITSGNPAIIERDPARDVKDWDIAIDFGTSSTVVAYRDDKLNDKLLRIGIDEKHFLDSPEPWHFENPTVLKFIDFVAMKDAWNSEAYRPLVEWDHIKCSHEARDELSNKELDTKTLSCILTRIKQWALRDNEGERVLITDIKGHEHKLASLIERHPVTGIKLTVSPEYPFDPIELYAWFLGLTINWRGRGLFLRYYMTFPVTYPQTVKQKILASFRRGLQRSLPETLVDQTEVLKKFAVEECASEPAAYAVAAFNFHKLEPKEKGLAYAVFDFGGGTTDFDFGYYRLPSADEEQEGYEVVLEQRYAAGDRFLGGENLLENMAYRVFQKNLKVCKDKKIKFSKPLDADDFPGSEKFIDNTQAALTNSQMLMSALRPLWEKGVDITESGVKKINLINCNNERLVCDLSISITELNEYLESRIEKGIDNFCVSLKKAFQDNPPDDIHLFLGGNASHSPIVQGFFGLLSDKKGQFLYERTCKSLFEGITLKPYLPLPTDEKNVYQATAKTGVALGLLNLCPGGSIKLVKSGNEAPFAFFVGWIRQRKFEPRLIRGCQYHKWCQIGQLRDNVFNMVYSQSSRIMEPGDMDLNYERIIFTGNKGSGYGVFAKAISPNEVEVCAAKSETDLKNNSDTQKFTLK